jgi:hypothetical protein
VLIFICMHFVYVYDARIHLFSLLHTLILAISLLCTQGPNAPAVSAGVSIPVRSKLVYSLRVLFNFLALGE